MLVTGTKGKLPASWSCSVAERPAAPCAQAAHRATGAHAGEQHAPNEQRLLGEEPERQRINSKLIKIEFKEDFISDYLGKKFRTLFQISLTQISDFKSNLYS